MFTFPKLKSVVEEAFFYFFIFFYSARNNVSVGWSIFKFQIIHEINYMLAQFWKGQCWAVIISKLLGKNKRKKEKKKKNNQ